MTQHFQRTLRYWWPVLAWASIIIAISGNMASYENSGVLLRLILRLTLGELDRESFGLLHHLVRKGAHVLEYAMLSMLAFRAWRGQALASENDASSAPDDAHLEWRLSWMFYALALCLVVASSDEFRQHFFASRTGNVWDIVLDMSGALLGQAAVFVVIRWQQRRAERQEQVRSAVQA